MVGRSLLVPGVDDRVVVVRDDEPTSLVAYALSSRCAVFPSTYQGACTHILIALPRFFKSVQSP